MTARRLLDPLAGQGPALAAVAVGGAVGALARHAVGVAAPHRPGTFPWAVFGVNVTGCLLIGVLIVAVTEGRRVPALARPFLGTGVLGGYTTFSTYAVDGLTLLGTGDVATAAAYVVGTLVAAVAATWLGLRLARAVLHR
ncbi:MAG: fluoride efflux transporter CrcB [Pseudonocardia sp.]|nr:fluoride efflux transporter CrcB [Pseudonocardia sp.]